MGLVMLFGVNHLVLKMRLFNLLALFGVVSGSPNIVVILVDDWGWANNGIHRTDGEFV